MTNTPHEGPILLMDKQHVKETVNESLLEALQVANDKKQAISEARGFSWFLDVLGKIIPVVIIALVSWVCIAIIDVQKDVLAMRLQIAQVENHLLEHNLASAKTAESNAIVHHTVLVSNNKCDSCHVQFYRAEDSGKARKQANAEKDEFNAILDTKIKKK